MSLAAFASGPVWAYSADLRFGHEATLAASMAVTGFVSVLVYLAHDRALLAVAAVALWAFRAPNASLADAIALDRLRSDRRGGDWRGWPWAGLGWGGAGALLGAVLAAPAV